MKRGMSGVILTIIMIALVLVATTIVWGVVSNILTQQANSVSGTSFGIDLDIEKYQITDDGLSVTLVRGSGKGDLAGVAFVTTLNGKSTTTKVEANLDELGTETFILPGVYSVDSISLAPIVETDSGIEETKNVIETKNVDSTKLTINYLSQVGNLVSWWKFEGNANDEVGSNDGVLIGGMSCDSEGKFGQSCSFDGINDYVNLANPASLKITGSKTYSAWFRTDSEAPNAGFDQVIFGHRYNQDSDCQGINAGLAYTNLLRANICDSLRQAKYVTMRITPLEFDRWYHMALVHDNSAQTWKMYLDGVLVSTRTGVSGTAYSTISFKIGAYNGGVAFFDGQIDEPMIFNKALSDEEVQALANLNLS